MAIKVAENAGIGPIALAAARALPAGVVLGGVAALTRRWHLPAREDLPALLAMGVTTALFFGLTFVGAERLSGALGSLLANSSPLFAVMLAAVVEGERVELRALGGVALGAVGVGVTALPALADAPGDLVAMATMLVGASALALNTIAMKRASHLDPLMANAAQMLGAGVLLAAAAGLGGELHPPAASPATLAAVAYLSLAGTALAYVLWSGVLASLPLAVASALLFFVPVFGHIWSWLLLREPIVPAEAIGASIAVAGIALAAAAGVSAGVTPPLEPE